MINRLFVWLALLLLATAGQQASADTASYQDLTRLAKEVEERVYDAVENYRAFSQLSVTVAPLDNRLRLQACDEPLTFNTDNVTHQSNRASVKVSCSAPIPWSIYVPAVIDGSIIVAVASHSLPRSSTLTEDDIDLTERRLSDLPSGYITEPGEAIGQETRRNFTKGDPFRVSALTPPKVVKRGDAVVVEASTGGIAVITPGEALADGRVGQQIRVKNSRSERTIKAVVVGPGRVEVRL